MNDDIKPTTQTPQSSDMTGEPSISSPMMPSSDTASPPAGSGQSAINEPSQTLPVEMEQPTGGAIFGTAPSENTFRPGDTSMGDGGKKKKIILASVLGAAFILLLGSGVAAYNLWYQNPDKVLGDALVNMIRAKSVTYTGSVDMTNKAAGNALSPTAEGMKLTVDGKNVSNTGELNAKLSVKYDGKSYDISGSGLVDKDANLFVKINDVKKLITKYAEENGGSYSDMPSYMTAIVDKIDSKWIRISAADIDEFSEGYSKKQKCVTDTLKKLENDKAATDEVIELYKNNKFVVVKNKLSSENGSLGYNIDFDYTKAKSFMKGLNDTKIIKEVQKCDEDFRYEEKSASRFDDEDDDTVVTTNVWVGRWNHQLTKLHVTTDAKDSKGTILFEPIFNQAVTVEAPKEFVTFQELKKDVENAFKQYQQEAARSYQYDDSMSTTSALFSGKF